MDQVAPGQSVVLAFEDREEAATYAESLLDDEEYYYDAVASVQALDVEALVVTSRDADFRVGLVFTGDLTIEGPVDGFGAIKSGQLEIITSGDLQAPKRVAIERLTMVPDTLYAEKSPQDFLDLEQDPIWVRRRAATPPRSHARRAHARRNPARPR